MCFIGAMMVLSLAACTPTMEKHKVGEVQSSNGVISIIDLPKGIYTFSITCNGKTYSTKWMK